MKILSLTAYMAIFFASGMGAAGAAEGWTPPSKLIQSGNISSDPGRLIIGGVVGGSRTSPSSRNCYGSTLCNESGTYIGDQGVLHYDGSNTIVDRRQKPLIRPTLPSGHIEWCSSQYRSYRTSDNSFQPFNGQRRNCTSPYN